jgi:hypothetical protein
MSELTESEYAKLGRAVADTIYKTPVLSTWRMSDQQKVENRRNTDIARGKTLVALIYELGVRL